MGSIVMDRAMTQDEVVIGVGSPVKPARALTEKERGFFSYTAGNYVKLKDQHLAEGYAD